MSKVILDRGSMAVPNKPPIDGWTFVHYSWGFVARYIGAPETTWILGMFGWEIYEQSTLAPPLWAEPPPNKIIDILVGYLGYHTVKWLES